MARFCFDDGKLKFLLLLVRRDCEGEKVSKMDFSVHSVKIPVNFPQIRNFLDTQFCFCRTRCETFVFSDFLNKKLLMTN